MTTLVIWWTCILVESVILIRGLQVKAVAKFPFFYLYIASLLVSDFSLYFVHLYKPEAYASLNWNCGLLNLLLACGILLEIFRHALLPYPGAERFARISGTVIFLVVFAVLGGCLLVAPTVFQSRLMNTNLERNLLAVQAVFLCGLIAIMRRYRVALTKNISGMTLGYGLCIGLTLLTLATRLYAGPSFNRAWILLQPFWYLVCLLIWAEALWRYEPGPTMEAEVVLASDYETFATETQGSLEAMRSNLSKAARP